MLENLRQAFQGIWSHKMRSFLTMLGIIIGIAAIIAIVSTIKGANEQIKQNLIGAGKNTVDICLRKGGEKITIYDSSSIPQGVPQISEQIMEEIRDLKEVESATSYNERMTWDSIYFRNTAISDLKIYGVDTDYFTTCSYIVKTGRLFLPEDYEEYRKVVITDATASKSLFGDENPIGKTIEISSQPFMVVGVITDRSQKELEIEDLEELYDEDSNGALYLPKASWPIVFNYDEPQNVTVKAVDTDSMTQAAKKTAAILNEKLNLGNESSVKYNAESLADSASNMRSLTDTTNLLLLLVAGISLLVGGIGVMNIMLVSVTERISEIGLKKAIGARKRTILGQFLTEAAMLTSIGGLLGVAAGVGTAYLIHHFAGLSVAIDIPASVIAVVFSMVIGLLFGFLPSVQASNLDPIEALRRE